MQLIRKVQVSAQEYVLANAQCQMVPPHHCAVCKSTRRLAALGYYARNLTVGSNVIKMFIRRFRCMRCGKTTSVLPAFVQPYRLVQNELIHEYFSKPDKSLAWRHLLAHYWQRFTRWLPRLAKALIDSSRGPPSKHPEQWWTWLCDHFGMLDEMTATLASRFGMTLFGCYKCHNISR